MKHYCSISFDCIFRGIDRDIFIIISSNLNYLLDEIVEMNSIAMEAPLEE